MNIQDIKVQKGEKIQPAWERLVKWVDTLKVVPSDGVRVRETPKGTIVTVIKDSKSYRHPFKASISDSVASVSAGTVNGQTPYILDVDTNNWRRIDNRDDGGNKFVGKSTPKMKLDLKNHEGGKFYLLLRIKPNMSGAINDPSENLRIVQSPTVEGFKDLAGYYPLALIYLNAARTTVEESFQIVHHNIRYLGQSFESKEESNKGEITSARHLFLPV